LLGAIWAIEIAFQNQWFNLWLETDSELVVKAFYNHTLILWPPRNRWLNCLFLTSSMNFLVSHIYRKANECANALENMGLSLVNFFFLMIFLNLCMIV
jgi:ribonuclease HI